MPQQHDLSSFDLTQEDICFSCRTEDETDLNLGTSFSAETNRRDEDADMYVSSNVNSKINNT